MKKVKFGLMLTAFFAVLGSAAAQFSVGVRSGAYWANVDETRALDGLAPAFEHLRSFQAAVVGEYAFSDRFALQSELGLTRKGFGYRQGLDVELFEVPLPIGVRAEARFHYLELPVLAKLRFGGPRLQANIMAGPQLGYALNGKLVTRTDGLIELQLTESDIDLDGIGYQRAELAGTVGAGLSYRAPFGTLSLDARYTHGLTGLYDIPLVDETVRNRGFGVNLGFTVPLGGARPAVP